MKYQISNEFTKNAQVLKFVEDSANLCKPEKIVWITGDEAQLEELRKDKVIEQSISKDTILNENDILNIETKTSYVCEVCGYVHEGELSDDFICPICGMGKEAFKKSS